MERLFIDQTRLEISRIDYLYRECRPKLLVVTDGLDFSTAGFGLSQFVQTLRASTIHGMTPIVITAIHNPGAALSYDATTQHISNFDFTHATHGLVKSRYDVVFLLGYNSTGQIPTLPGELDAIGKFMEAGGGVFATGDHEDLGMALCGEVPRVRAMRKWTRPETPSGGGTDRLSTNLSGDNGTEEFIDQSDVYPQRLYPNFRTDAGGIGRAHPLLQRPGSPVDGRTIEVFPDHPHEGECRIPTRLGTSFNVDGAAVAEWPGGLAPEMVAMSMSHGNGFPGKQALVPRSFIAMAAYDGQAVNKGRVATDATWHHFININLDGAGSPHRGLRRPDGSDSPELAKIRQHYRNLAAWLMPRSVRRCLMPYTVATEVRRFPLFEELKLASLAEAKLGDLAETGALVREALSVRLPPFEVDALMNDALSIAVGDERAAKLFAVEKRADRAIATDAAQVALGVLTTTFLTKLMTADAPEKLDPHAWLDRSVTETARGLVGEKLAEARAELRKVDAMLAEVAEKPSKAD